MLHLVKNSNKGIFTGKRILKYCIEIIFLILFANEFFINSFSFNFTVIITGLSSVLSIVFNTSRNPNVRTKPQSQAKFRKKKLNEKLFYLKFGDVKFNLSLDFKMF